MRNTKNVKGFTLIELIVVIAIIGILAAILVPSMLGFVRDAKISSANANAHTIYTAAQSWLTKYVTANDVSKTKGVASGGSSQAWVEATGKNNFSIGTITGVDFTPYLGENLKGRFSFKLGADGASVSFAAWSGDTSATCPTVSITSAAQEKDAQDNKALIGFHPLIETAAGTTTV